MSHTHFATYKQTVCIHHGIQITRKFIVLKYSDGTMDFTDYHRYISRYSRSTRRAVPVNENGNNRFSFVQEFLNYAFFSVGIKTLDDLTLEIAKHFLDAYGMCELPEDNELTSRESSTVEMCVDAITSFIERYISSPESHCSIKEKDLYKSIPARDKNHHVIYKKVPVLWANYIPSAKKPILRDIPNSAFRILLGYIRENHMEIFGLVLLSAFCGLRGSESCNVRQVCSPLGPGFIIDEIDGKVLKIEIDLRHEYVLRSDNKPVGYIKKERTVTVPALFLKAFYEGYEIYTEYLSRQNYETAYCPFSVNSQGKAITYDNYLQKFHYIIKNEIIPIFLNDPNPEVVNYGRILMEKSLSTHVFRHWFTVQLVLSGIKDPGTIQFYRGDKSPESAITYLNSKGELEKQYRKVTNEVFDYLTWASRQPK